MSGFRRLIDCEAEFLIPLAVVFETSGHIKSVQKGFRPTAFRRTPSATRRTVAGCRYDFEVRNLYRTFSKTQIYVALWELVAEGSSSVCSLSHGWRDLHRALIIVARL